MTTVWLAAFVLLLIIEAATVGLTAIWFALGSLAGLVSAALNAPLWLQVLLFIIVSAVTLFLTRPLAAKYLNPARKATNADRVIDMAAVVTEEINNIKSTGAVSVSGKVWTARSLTGEVFAVGDVVRADHIEGVKLIVRPSEHSNLSGECPEE